MVGEGLDSETIDDLYQSIVTSQPRWPKGKREIKQELLGETSDTENEIDMLTGTF